ncbi:conserved hypothetical protein [uncultured Spirochaetota bacterium]|jgi:hypothetical protein|nr:conserved hypothetical protein [uncultured Spirochaetota bacterium]
MVAKEGPFMTQAQFAIFDALRKDFSAYVENLNRRSPWLKNLQDELRESLGYQDYEVETPIVYNTALDDIGPRDQPLFLIVADNPGKNEQKTANRRYLVGQSGKLAKGWFAAELNLDFYKACIIINKTPLHTPKTAELRGLRKIARSRSAELDKELALLLDESQRFMAALAFNLHSTLNCVLWVSGYGELSPGKLFSVWAEETKKLYADSNPELRENFWVFKHFSMNQFAIEYKKSTTAPADPMSGLASIGKTNRFRILGW